MARTVPVTPPFDEQPHLSRATILQRKLIGGILLAYTLLLFLALISYDWHDIAWLNNPTPNPPMNYIGKLGAWLTFFGYGIAGLAYRYFAIPLLVILSCFLLHGRVPFFRLKLLWFLLLYTTLACLFQTYGGVNGSALPLLETLNLRPNAGGALGQWLVSDTLKPLLGSVGLQLFLWPLALLFIILLIGVRNCLLLTARLTTPRTPRAVEDARKAEGRERLIERAAPTGDEVDDEPEATAPRENIFTRLFKHKPAPEAPVEDDLDVKSLLAKRTPRPEPEEWVRPEKKPVDEPLFNRTPTPAPAPMPAPTPPPTRRAAPPVEKKEEPFTLSSDDAPLLKPVSPLNSKTALAPASNDNDDAETDSFADYGLPSTDLLDPIPPPAEGVDNVQQAIDAIESVFEQFKIAAKVTGYIRGPVLTQFEVSPGSGVKLERFRAYERNFLLALRAESIRIQAPIPGRDVVGIEVPNATRQSVTLREILEGKKWREAERKMALPLALGKLATGGDLIVDLAEMPHLLVAGGTGSGKSVAVNDMLIGLLMCRKPEQVRLLMVDPKRVEFTAYDNLPHLLNPVVVEPKKVLFSLRWAVIEMNHRYKLLQRYGVRNIADYNKRVTTPDPHRENPTTKLPYIVIIVDELAELMLTVRSEIEGPITSLTQKARAAGIHMIIATQRPTTDIITGTIKANIPGRIALRVSQANDSRTILDETGAENLIGKGDMLLANGGTNVRRSQAAWVSDGEIARICNFIKEQAGPSFNSFLADNIDRIKEDKPQDDVKSLISEFTTPEPENDAALDLGPEEDKSDEGYYQRALELIRQTGRFSTSALQRRLGIGYNKAGRITDMLEERGIIGPQTKAGGSREILVDLNAMAREAVAGTDGEEAVQDTRTVDTEEPELPSPEAYTYEATADAAPDDDFDIGDFNPSDLDGPNIIHPSKP